MNSLAGLVFGDLNLMLQNTRPFTLRKKIHTPSAIWILVMDPAKLFPEAMQREG